MPVVRTLIAIMLLQAGPQDLPCSTRLLRMLVVFYMLSGVVAFKGTIDTDMALANVIADILVIMAYTYLLLRSLDRRPRFVQTASAMIGVGILFHILVWPVLLQTELVDGQTAIPIGASMLMLMLLSWSLLVNAHIFRQALEFGLSSAILLSFALFFVSLAVSRYLLPQS